MKLIKLCLPLHDINQNYKHMDKILLYYIEYDIKV